VSGDRVIRFATAAVVCAVAAFAAVVSYSHIYGLGRAHGQDGTAARLLPLSVDGLILAASLVLLHEARNDRDAPPLARLMLWLGIGATIGANIAFGTGYGLLGALISAWPAVAFIGSVEIATQLVRRVRGPQAPTSAPEVPSDVEQAVRTAYAASVAGRGTAEPACYGRAVRPVPAQGGSARYPGHRIRQRPSAREGGGVSMKSYDETTGCSGSG